MDYRKDIDGLRAISIIFVILFHSELSFFNNLFQGGFIGVDIFFVISGFLITGVLFDYYNNNKNVKIFYLRRARRLLPALYIVILLSVFLSFFFLISNYYDEFYWSVISSTTFFSNFFYAFNSDYFDTPYYLKPLIHTWSLSIEFQFYLFYPIILFWCLKYLSENKVILLLLFLCFLNLIYVQFGGNLQFSYPYIENNLSFFNPPTAGTFFYTTSRIWEFLIGGVSYFVYRKELNINVIVYYIGLILIVASLFYFKRNIDNPGLNNLVPVLGTSFILIVNKNNYLKEFFLSNRYVVFIGMISYSLYLIHFPIFSFSKYIFVNNGYYSQISITFCLIILSFFLSYLSWRYVEKPFRSSKNINDKKFVTLIFSILFFTIFTNYVVKDSKKNDEITIKEKYKNINFNITKNSINFEDNRFSDNNKIKVLILGDSQSVDLFKILKSNSALSKEFEFSYFNNKFEIYYLSENTKISKKFRKELIMSQKFLSSDIIILSSDYSDKDLRSLDKNIKFLKNFNKKIIIANVFPKFIFGNPVKTILLKNKDYNLSNEEIGSKLFLSIKKSNLDRNKQISIKAKENQILLFDRSNLICDFKMKICNGITDNGDLIFSDFRHVTDYGAEFITNSKYLYNFFNKLK